MVLRFIILICCINLYLVASYAQTLSDELVFEERVFDFGEIKEENGLVSHEFEFKNVSQKVISINGVTSGCGCVQFEFPKEPLRPNATGKVKVTYNPAYRPGFFSKEVVVLSNNNANYNRIDGKRHSIELDGIQFFHCCFLRFTGQYPAAMPDCRGSSCGLARR